MEDKELKQLIDRAAAGELTLEAFKERLASTGDISILAMEEATLDLNRAARQGFPEVVYCEGKTDAQCAHILEALAQRYDTFMGTRARASIYEALQNKIDGLQYDELSRLIYRKRNWQCINGDRTIAVVTAGTSDLPVAEEAALTAELMGNQVTRVYDVGVAGIHRLFHRIEDIEKANVVIVVAGMEGALASVIGGLVSKPTVAVPTSVGYGANFGGLAALLAMLNSCAAGVGVVNIDNGFGAGRLAHIINSQR